MAKTFKDAWGKHPANLGENYPCRKPDGTEAFANQCAIRLSIALKDAGFAMDRFGIAKCWYHKGASHYIRAEELANWLRLNQITQFGPAEIKKEVTSADYSGRTGIVFFKDFWTREGERSPSGDHIDLWDGSQMAHGSDSYFESSVQVWFWDLK
jgi:hypothetical protein